MKPLPREFYARDTATVARDLLGKLLVRRVGKTVMSGIITETEAYKHRDDPASHAYGGITGRNMAMFGQVGRVYVYFTYGMHHCVNAVARSRRSDAGAVLIRAVMPQAGIGAMVEHRGGRNLQDLTNGPAKVAQAMRIDKKLYGADLTGRGEIFIAEGPGGRVRIRASARVGISKAADRLWNFKVEI